MSIEKSPRHVRTSLSSDRFQRGKNTVTDDTSHLLGKMLLRACRSHNAYVCHFMCLIMHEIAV
jgi:hypothetical protein